MNVDSGAPHFAYLHGRTVLRILFPRISKKATHLLHTVILTDTHRATPHPHQSIPGMRTDTAYGHARPPHPCRFAVLVHAGGCWFPGCFWRWPVAAYAAYARVTAARSVPGAPQRWQLLCGHIGPHPRKWICVHVFSGHMHVAVCWAW